MVNHDVRATVNLLLARLRVRGKTPTTQAELARLLGVHPSHLNRTLAGKKGGAAVTMGDVAEVLGCTVEDIFTGGRM